MSSTRVTGNIVQSSGTSSIQSQTFNVNEDDLIVWFWEHDDTHAFTSVSDLAGNSYTLLSGAEQNDGNQFVRCMYCLASAPYSNNQITVNHAFASSVLAWAVYRAGGGSDGYVLDTTPSNPIYKIGGYGESPIATASFNTGGAGVVVATLVGYYGQTETIADNSSALTTRYNGAGTAGYPAVNLADNIYSAAQTGLVVGCSTAASDRLAIVAVSFKETSSEPIIVTPDYAGIIARVQRNG